MTFVKNIARLAIIVFLVSCGGGDSPKSVAEHFLKALNKMDYETAKKYGTEDTGRLLDMISGFAKMSPDSVNEEKSFDIKDEKIDGDKATVTYVQSGEVSEQTLDLVKIEGKWKVAMSKDSMNGEDEGRMDSGATTTDTTSNEQEQLDTTK